MVSHSAGNAIAASMPSSVSFCRDLRFGRRPLADETSANAPRALTQENFSYQQLASPACCASDTGETHMKCDFGTIVGLILGAIGVLAAAISLAQLWPYPGQLFIAAALVATVSGVFFSAIRSALLACSPACDVSSLVNTLGQAASALAAIPFLVAALLQLKALAFIATTILAWVGLAIDAAVGLAVTAGTVGCVIVIGILVGLLVQVLVSKPCFDSQRPSPPKP
jgi:hypothetical protein